MSIVSFVSPGKNSNLVAMLSSLIGLEYNLRILVMHKDPHGRTERILLGRKVFEAGDGILELARQTRSRKLTPESVRDNSKFVIKGFLDVLPCTADAAIDVSTFVTVAGFASKIYDFVFIDVQNCPDDEVKEIVKVSDRTVVALNQDKFLIESYAEKARDARSGLPVLEDAIVVLEDYDPNSKYTASKIGKYFKLPKTPIPILHSTPLCDATNDMEMVNFMRRARNARKDHPNAAFMESCRKMAADFIKAFGLNEEAIRK